MVALYLVSSDHSIGDCFTVLYRINTLLHQSQNQKKRKLKLLQRILWRRILVRWWIINNQLLRGLSPLVFVVLRDGYGYSPLPSGDWLPLCGCGPLKGHRSRLQLILNVRATCSLKESFYRATALRIFAVFFLVFPTYFVITLDNSPFEVSSDMQLKYTANW